MRCRGCVCAKAKRACTTCAPGRGDRGRCQNRPLSAVDVPSQPTSLPFTFSLVVSTPPRPSTTAAQENQSPTSPSCEGNSTCTEADLVPSRPEQSYCRNVGEYSTTDTRRGSPYEDSQGPVNRSDSSPHSLSSTLAPSPSLRSSLRPDGTLSLFPADPGTEEPLDSSAPSSGVPMVVASSPSLFPSHDNSSSLEYGVDHDVNGSAQTAAAPAENADLVDSQREAEDDIGTHPVGDLPSFTPACDPNSQWGNLTGDEFSHAISAAYFEAVHWKRNIFLVPSGAEGKEFVQELARIFGAYAERSALESFAMTAAMTMPLLLLQKPHGKSTTRDHVACLRRRLLAWKSGDVDGLVQECRAIQEHLRKGINKHATAKNEVGARRGFTKLMLLGNVRGALRVLSESPSGGVHSLSAQVEVNGEQHQVLDILKGKHPQTPAPVHPDALVDSASTASLPFHPVLFEKIDGDSIRQAALRTEGSAGPSGIDAKGWRRICTAFHGASTSLCNALAAATRRLCTEYVDPTPLHALIACRLIPLDKNPGVRPIGVCETARRIIGKAISSVLHHDIRAAAGPLQLCAGQPAGCEAAVHALADVFSSLDTEAVVLVDASNAFNQLNRQLALRNISVLCPSLACFVINIYRANAPLFVGGEVIYSREGTTQGDPLAMAIFAIAIRPLIDRLAAAKATQVWFADDAASGGKLRVIRMWWDMLVRYGPLFGYYVNAIKSWLLVKTDSLEEATTIFADTGLNITTSGVRHLGAPLGDAPFSESFVAERVNKWKEELARLADIAAVQPHLAFCALTQGLVSRWTYLCRTADNTSESLRIIEDVLQKTVLPSLTGHASPGPEI